MTSGWLPVDFWQLPVGSRQPKIDVILASVHSGEEQSFIQSAVHDNLWIGGSRMSSSSGFSWSDQTTFDFNAWVNGFPSQSETGQRCVQMLVGEDASGWVDESCTSSAGIICKDVQVWDSADSISLRSR